MGGVSTGGVDFATEDGHAFARITDRVSTANSGGFIKAVQMSSFAFEI